MNKYAHIAESLKGFLRAEVTKRGFDRVIVGLSGGLDSAVVAVLAQRVFKDDLLCVKMPSQYSSQSSLTDADTLCKDFSIKAVAASIEPMLRAYEELNPDMDRLRVGNFSARMRMSTIFDISARENALVLGTSNKSELMLGYGTLYGDLACAINPIGDLYKSEIYKLAKYLGVSKAIINKAPSADLWQGQSDEDDLGYTYAQIDIALRLLVDEKLSKEDILKKGIDREMLEMITKRVTNNSFKLEMPKIAKINREEFRN
ncbi:MAG: NAD+ synthase [Sulfurimonas sp.]|uniref:NAD+ synthase n=1 Tax=Sulfurimonas sp. TaxID=2022749 RepID=UPI0025E9F0BC|nr:NAD+ synthase [Sulfurimonas sp.]MCK9491365.1 NAD+ synthase [Sulfurimonas sp.]